jgi:hypothetical protein
MGYVQRAIRRCIANRPVNEKKNVVRTIGSATETLTLKVSAVARIDSDVFQRLAFRADIAVLFGHVGELVGSAATSATMPHAPPR